MKRMRIFLASIALVIGLSGALPAVALADSAKDVVCTSLGSNNGCTTTPHGAAKLNDTLSGAINILSWVVGVASVIMIIVSGLRLITANGDSNSIASARSGIIYALIGLVIVAFSRAMVYFVLNKV